jgi:hypothetical protein
MQGYAATSERFRGAGRPRQQLEPLILKESCIGFSISFARLFKFNECRGCPLCFVFRRAISPLAACFAFVIQTLVPPTNNQDYLGGQGGFVDHAPCLAASHTTSSRTGFHQTKSGTRSVSLLGCFFLYFRLSHFPDHLLCLILLTLSNAIFTLHHSDSHAFNQLSLGRNGTGDWI